MNSCWFEMGKYLNLVVLFSIYSERQNETYSIRQERCYKACKCVGRLK